METGTRQRDACLNSCLVSEMTSEMTSVSEMTSSKAASSKKFTHLNQTNIHEYTQPI